MAWLATTRRRRHRRQLPADLGHLLGRRPPAGPARSARSSGRRVGGRGLAGPRARHLGSTDSWLLPYGPQPVTEAGRWLDSRAPTSSPSRCTGSSFPPHRPRAVPRRASASSTPAIVVLPLGGSHAVHEEPPIATPPPSNSEPRINDRIRAREVRLVGPDGAQIGIKPLPEALAFARELDLDLVEVAAMANPPVCRVMDFGKFKYEAAQQAKESRRKSIGRRHQGDEVPAQDRDRRLRHQDPPGREVPRPGSQGEGDDHVPRPRGAAPGARPARSSSGSPTRCSHFGQGRGHAEARRSQHGDGAGARQAGQGGMGEGAGRGEAEPTRRPSSRPTGRRQRPTADEAPVAPTAETVDSRRPTMPKMKTHKGAAKRFKVTGTRQAHAPPRQPEPHPREEVARSGSVASAATSSSSRATPPASKRLLGR